MTTGWEHYHHGADIGVRGFGPTRDEAYEQAALALVAVMTDPAAVRPLRCVEVRCEAPDDELLLVDWLNAIVYSVATEHMLFGRFVVTSVAGGILGRLWGEPVDVAEHRPAVEVKGATYTELAVTRDEAGLWRAQCVVDV